MVGEFFRQPQLHKVDEVRLEGVCPRKVPVSRELGLFVAGHEFHTTSLIPNVILVVSDGGLDQIFSSVVETVDFPIQPLHPVGAGKGKLERVDTFGRKT